jgi:hypothetical protein
MNKVPDYSIVPTGILNDKQITFRAMKVYIAIKSFMNKETHECFPSRQLISKMTDIPVARVSVETDLLEKMGLIKKTGSWGRSTPCVYTMLTAQPNPETVTELITVIPQETVTESVTVIDSETVTESDKTVTELSRNGYRIDTKTVTESVRGKEQTIEQTKNKPEEQTTSSFAPNLPSKPSSPKRSRSEKANDHDLSSMVLPDWLPAEPWQQYLLHRQRMKKPMSVYGAEKLINELNEAKNNGWSPEEVLNNAIISGYQGCVFDKHKQPKPTSTFNAGGNNGKQHKLSSSDILDRMHRQTAINQSKNAALDASETGRILSGVEYSVEGRGNTVNMGVHD